MRRLLCTLAIGLTLCLETVAQTCNRSIHLVFAIRREDPKSQRLIESVQKSVIATNKQLEQGLHNISNFNLTIQEIGEGADNVTLDMLSIQLLDKPDILLTTHNFYDYKLMAGIAHSGGFPVWSARDMIQWGASNELPSEYGNIAVVPKLSAIIGVSDARGQIIYDLVAGLGLQRVLEIKTESNESAVLTAFHNILRTNRKKKVQTKQLEVEEEASTLQTNLLLALRNDSKQARLLEVKHLLEFKPEVIVIECFLGLTLDSMVSAMAKPKNQDHQMITDSTIVVFLHHPDSVLEWSGRIGLLKTTSNVFLLEQLPTGLLPHDGSDINEALAYDSITAIRETISLVGNYNPCDRVETLVRGNVKLSYSSQGNQLAGSARQLCLHEKITKSGRIRFTSETDVCKDYDHDQLPVQYKIIDVANMGLFANWNSKLKPSLQIYDLPKANNLNQTGIKITNIKDLGVIIATSTPFAYRDDKTGELAGVAIDLLNNIAEKGNFSYQPNVKIWDNGTWDELAKGIGGGKLRCGTLKCHIAVGAITVTPDRASTANFTRSFFTSGLRILAPIKNNNEDPSIWNFFKPFHWTVWLTTAAMILVSSLIAARLDIAQGITEGMWLSVSVIYAMHENSLVRMRNPFGRIYILVFSFVLLVLVSSYTANMVSFLTVRNANDDVTDINGLRRVRVAVRSWASDWKALQDAGVTDLLPVQNGTTGVEAIIRSTDTVANKDSANDNNSTNPVANVYVADSAHLELLKSQTCHVKVTSSREIFKQQYAFVMMQGYEYSDTINKLITEAIADGVVQDSYNNHTHKKSVHCEDEGSTTLSDDDLSLGISNLGGVFLIAAAVGALCLACKLIAMFFRRREQTLKITTDDPQKLPIPLHEFGTADAS